MASPTSGALLLERQHEVRCIARALDAPRHGTGAALLVEGRAGVGKTRLFELARKRAADRGMRVVTAVAGELERELAFGVVRQLFGAAARAGVGWSAGDAARLAGPALGVELEGSQPVADTHAVLHGLYWLAAELAEPGGLTIAVDDAHWADPPSLRFLSYLARRLDGLGIALVVTARPGTGEAALAELLRAPRIEVVRPQALSVRAIAQLMGVQEGDERAAVMLDSTGGNPFLVASAVDHGLVEGFPTDQAAFAADVVTRLVGVGEDELALAQAVAVLGAQGQLQDAARLAELTLERAGVVADHLAAVGVLAAGRPVRFEHPLLRTAVYEGIPPARRAVAHRAAARQLAADGSDAATVAMHLMATEPSGGADVVRALVDAAEQATAQGALESVVGYLGRALREPPGSESRPGVLAALGRAESRTQDESGPGHLWEALRLYSASDRAAAVDVAGELIRCHVYSGRLDAAVEVAEHPMVREAEGTVDLVESSLNRDLLTVAQTTLSARIRVLPRLDAVRGRALADATAMDPVDLVHVAWELICTTGERATAMQLLELAEASLGAPSEMDPDSPVTFFAASMPMLADRPGRSADNYRRLLHRSQHRGSARGFAFACGFLGLALVARGELAEAESRTRAALEIGVEDASGFGLPVAVAVLAETLIEREDLTGASDAMQHLDIQAQQPDSQLLQYLVIARGSLALAQGHPEMALEHLAGTRSWAQAWGWRNPLLLSWHIPTVEALVAVGRHAEALEIADRVLANSRADDLPTAIATALRLRAIAQGPEGGLDELREAAAVSARSESAIERARVLVELGARLAAAGERDEARAVLREGLGLANGCGSTRLVRRALHELRAIGVRPRRAAQTGVAALTPSERHIAELAARGMTNREIAQSTFLTLKAVEAHLTRSYRKLGIRSRGGLARAMDKR